ncbi:MAG: hypothetical protein ACFE0I_20620 [Elainellaceae cyanobacterium]
MKDVTTQCWTTQRFLRLGKYLADAYGVSLSHDGSEHTRDQWTTERLIHFSNSLSQGYSLGR